MGHPRDSGIPRKCRYSWKSGTTKHPTVRTHHSRGPWKHSVAVWHRMQPHWKCNTRNLRNTRTWTYEHVNTIWATCEHAIHATQLMTYEHATQCGQYGAILWSSKYHSRSSGKFLGHSDIILGSSEYHSEFIWVSFWSYRVIILRSSGYHLEVWIPF